MTLWNSDPRQQIRSICYYSCQVRVPGPLKRGHTSWNCFVLNCSSSLICQTTSGTSLGIKARDIPFLCTFTACMRVSLCRLRKSHLWLFYLGVIVSLFYFDFSFAVYVFEEPRSMEESQRLLFVSSLSAVTFRDTFSKSNYF